MSRDPNQLRVFCQADQLVTEVYRYTRDLSAEERFGLQSPLRRAAVSVPANIVEGCSRPSERECRRCINIAAGSASEVRYLLRLSSRLGFATAGDLGPLNDLYDQVVRALHRLAASMCAGTTHAGYVSANGLHAEQRKPSS